MTGPARIRGRRLLASLGALAAVALLVVLLWPAPAPSTVAPRQWDAVNRRRPLPEAALPPAVERPPAESVAPSAAETPPAESEAPPAGPEWPPTEGSPQPPDVPPATVGPPPVTRAAPERVAQQRIDALAARSIIELQPHRVTSSVPVTHPGGFDTGRLINLNPAVNEWHLLTLSGPAGEVTWHLALVRPGADRLLLSPDWGHGLVLEGAADASRCALWGPDAALDIAQAASAVTPYVELCGGRVLLRTSATGRRTARERTTDFLRDRVVGGEQITRFVRKTVYKDAWRQEAQLEQGVAPTPGDGTGPRPVHLDPSKPAPAIVPTGLGLRLAGTHGVVRAGDWYGVEGLAGAWVATVAPNLLDPAQAGPWRERLPALDDVERGALTFLLAFDLDAYTLGFTLGADHPRVSWSERAPPAARDARPGPDGFGTALPLARTGVLSPADAGRVVATFTAGFKRSHGAFKSGPMSTVPGATHYGFVEQGVVFSRLQPGLSTVVVNAAGEVDVRVWGADEATDDVVFARQNGVPLVQPGPAGPEPGLQVPRWGAGNWSGSADEKLRSLRAGACLIEQDGRRFLVYGWFSTATPSGMARIFLAADCRDALLLDMNALEHTYAAVYRTEAGELQVSHLADGMEVLDIEQDGRALPRFLGFSDSRDFFWIVPRDGSK